MKKIFWVAVGIGIGVLASRQLARVKSAAPLAVADSTLDRLTTIAQGAAKNFKAGMTEREAELKVALGIEAAPRGRHAGDQID